MLNKRMGRTEKIISKLEDRTIEITQSKQRENGLGKKKWGGGWGGWGQSLYNKRPNICVTGVPEGQQKEAGLKKHF